MKTIFYQTDHFIQHSGNLVDLEEFRRRSALAQQDSLARQPEAENWTPEFWDVDGNVFHPIVLTLDKKARRRVRKERRAWVLDVCASVGIIAMTLLFFLRLML